MPAVNEDLMLQAMIVSAKSKTNQIACSSRRPDWKIQTLTPNPDVIYLKPFFNTEDLTGCLPLTASDPMAWVRAHIARQLVPPAPANRRPTAVVES
jgi:hypothetical protein